jgi:hypothetical protein
MTNSKYQALLKSSKDKSILKQEEALDDRRKAAAYFVKRLQGANKWLLKRNIRRLCFHLDFDFVRSALMTLYKTTKYDDVKQLIKDIHDGTHDYSDLIEEMRDEQEYNQAIENIEKELLAQEFSQDLVENNYIQDHISLLNTKFSKDTGE